MENPFLNLGSIFQVDFLRVVPESDFSSRVEESFSSYRPAVQYDRNAISYNDDLSEACRRHDISAVMEGLPLSNMVLCDQLKRLAEVAASVNDSEIMSYIIQSRSQAISESVRANMFDTAAFTAAYCGSVQALKCLLDVGAVSDSAVDPSTGDSCLHIAAARNHRHIVEEICSRNPRLARGKNKDGLAPLHIAALAGHQQIVEYFLENGLCSPNFAAKGNNTALHHACQKNHKRIAEFLITQAAANLLISTNDEGFLPIHFAAAGGNLQLVRMLTEYMERCHNNLWNSVMNNRWTPLHCAVEAGHLEVVKHFCSLPSFKPELCTGHNYINPLHSAALHGMRPILEYLLSSRYFPPDALCQIFVLSNALHLAAYRGHIHCCQLLIDDYGLNPSTVTGSGFTAIHLAAGAQKLATLKYLVETKGHSPAVAQQLTKISPLHVAAASGHADIVSWLLSTGKCDANDPISVHKFTPLHIAASIGHLECVRALTAHRSCNPNAKAIGGITPLDCSNSEAICWELIKRGATPNKKLDMLHHYNFLQSWAAVLPSVRLFVIGNSGAGKSTLVKSLQQEHKWILGWFVPVKDVELHTAGIIPVNFESSKFGRVTIYDFAGHEEYYSSHEVFLNKVGHSLPIFLLVVDLRLEAGEVKRQISYWRNFIEQAIRTTGKQSKIVIVGSHFDCLRTSTEKSSKQVLLQAACNNDVHTHWVTINCCMPASGSMTKIRDTLQELCKEAKPSLPVIHHVHAFAAFLQYTFPTACQLHEIKSRIRSHGKPVTDFLDELEQLLHNLNNIGAVLYLPDGKKADDGWIIVNQGPILNGIHGYQERVKQKQLDTPGSGVLSFQDLKELFNIPDCNPNMVVRYLMHMEFCHEINNQEILRALTNGERQLHSRHFLFPDLIDIDAPGGMWQEDNTFTCYSGFAFRCQLPDEFITSRFFRIVFLRTTFTFAATIGIPANNMEVLLQECCLWKNGIHWVKMGIETIVELTEDQKVLLVMCRSKEMNKMDLIKHRAAVLGKISEVIQEFPKVSLDKLIIHPHDLCPPHPIVLSDQQIRFFKAQDILQALVTAEAPKEQHVTRSFLERSGSRTAASQCHIDELLLFEPYSLIRGCQLETVTNVQHNGPIEEQWLFENMANYNTEKWEDAAVVLRVTPEVVAQIRLKHQAPHLCFLDIIKEWLQTHEIPTFKDLREELDQYSIFRGETKASTK